MVVTAEATPVSVGFDRGVGWSNGTIAQPRVRGTRLLSG
jgi:hypothetical protein